MKEYGRIVTDSGPRLLKGVAILGAAAVISKLLGTLQKIPLQNIAGDEAFGIYSAVYPFYVLILFLATAGFPTAVSKMVSEQAASGHWMEARRIYRLSAVVLLGTGLITFLLMYMGAGLIAGWIGSSQSEQAIRSASYALLLVPLMAALRGYYQGLQNMIPTAVSQVMEQTVRVAVMIFLILVLTDAQASSGTIAAGATLGSAAGAAAGLVVMLVHDWRARSRSRQRSLDRPSPEPVSDLHLPTRSLTLLGRIVKHAVPVALGSIAVPIISMIDSFTLPNLLAASQGLNEQEALQQFGVYARGLPLVQLVAMLFSSMSVALVPALSDARALGDSGRVQRQAQLSVRLTMLIGFAASAGLAAVSLPINVMLFTDGNGTMTMAILAWTALFSSLNVVTAAILQGISKERLPAFYLLLAALVKVVGNLLLIPYFGISGAAWSGVIAYAVACILNLRAVHRYAGVTWRFRQDFLRPFVAVAAMLVTIGVLYGAFALLACLLDLGAMVASSRLWCAVQALIMIVVGAAVFGLAALRTGALSEEELKLVPGLYRRIAPLLRKWRILRVVDDKA